MDFDDLVREWQDTHRVYSFEGDSGIVSLNSLCAAIGYEGHQFRFGSPLEHFLSDNPGACDAMVEWMMEWGNTSPEWKEKLENTMSEEP